LWIISRLEQDRLFYKTLVREGADKSLDPPISRCRRTE